MCSRDAGVPAPRIERPDVAKPDLGTGPGFRAIILVRGALVATGTSGGNSSRQPAHALGWLPQSEEERALVWEELERIVASSGFRNSRKYPALLRYIVEHTLNGEAEHLKERTLGVEVFGRHPDYDTSVDPVVRIVAAEVRKRIGQYYHELAAPGKVLIDLSSGTYVPRFHIPERTAGGHPVGEPASLEPVSAPEGVGESPLVPQPARRMRLWRVNRRAWYAGAALSLILLIGAAAWLTRPQTTAMAQFWSPILDSPGAVLLVVVGGASWIPQSSGIPAGSISAASTAPPSIDEQQSRDLMAIADAFTLSDVAGILRSYRKAYLIRPDTLMDLPQLSMGSAVLIGAFNNPWTLRLTATLRFSFMRDLATNTNWIQDRTNKGMGNWKAVTTTPYALVTEDWAVISRFRNQDTEHSIVTAAGLSRWGTIAAGEFLTNPVCLAELARRAPANWGDKNLQVVIATKVINGQPGPPRILATEFW
jgi:hypothetical protein